VSSIDENGVIHHSYEIDLQQAGYDSGAEKERARIVAWLRDCAANLDGYNNAWDAMLLRSYAKRIERGEHT